MNDNYSYTDVEFETKAPEEPDNPRPVPRRSEKSRSRDITELLIPFLSVLILLFVIILAVAVALINAEITPRPGNNGEDTPSGVLQPSSDIKIEEFRQRPELPSAKSTIASAQYKPTGAPVAVSGINAKAALLVDFKSASGALNNDIMAGNSIDTQLPIASMTKIMTLIVCCDYISAAGDNALYKTVTLKNNTELLKSYSCAFVGEVDIDNSDATANVLVDEQTVYVIDMLYALILQSGADCAYGLADSFAGSETAFVAEMNKKAQALGMSDTKFSNCVGKDDNGKNLSTVRDVATMFAYALDNKLCYDIITAKSWVCVGKYRHQTLSSLVLSTAPKNNRDYGAVTVLGGKSGLETNARYCLVTLLQSSDGHKYICVTAGSSNSYTDTAAICKSFIK